MPEVEDILMSIATGRSIVVSRNVNVAVKLAVILARKAVEQGKSVIVIDEHGYFGRYAPLDLLERIRVTRDLEEACTANAGSLIIALMTKKLYGLKRCKATSLVIFTRCTTPFVRDNYAKYYLKRVPGSNEYLLACYDRGLTTRLSLEIDSVRVIESPPGIWGKVYDILKNTLSSYGELTMKDAVRAVSLELGVDKRRARSIVLMLARKGYIRVIRGRISLA